MSYRQRERRYRHHLENHIKKSLHSDAPIRCDPRKPTHIMAYNRRINSCRYRLEVENLSAFHNRVAVRQSSYHSRAGSVHSRHSLRQSCRIPHEASRAIGAWEEDFCPPPEISELEVIKGYDGQTFQLMDVPIPEDETLVKKMNGDDLECDDERENENNNGLIPLEAYSPSLIPTAVELTKDEARQVLIEYIHTRSCCPSRAAKKMTIIKMDHTNAYQYAIETITERRQTCWTTEPYHGGYVDTTNEGSAPLPWSVPVPFPESLLGTDDDYPLRRSTTMEKMNECSRQVEIPYTASIKTCHNCSGVGRKRCMCCSGNGTEECYSCKGIGQKIMIIQGESDTCYRCGGIGKLKCYRCQGEGVTTCRLCDGSGQVKVFLSLCVCWTVYRGDYISDENLSLLKEEIESSGVKGMTVLKEQGHQIRPLGNFVDPLINEASKNLSRQHGKCSQKTEKILKQLHEVKVIPISEIHYSWKGESDVFWVYGADRKVYAPNYRSSCCTIF